MPVFFYIDPDYVDDPFLENTDEITLSYTFFESKWERLVIQQLHSSNNLNNQLSLDVFKSIFISIDTLKDSDFIL